MTEAVTLGEGLEEFQRSGSERRRQWLRSLDADPQVTVEIG